MNSGVIVAVCCAAVAVGVAVLALTLLRRQPVAATTPVTLPTNPARVLRGDGIGNIRFGQAPAAAVHGVQRLLTLGRPTQGNRHLEPWVHALRLRVLPGVLDRPRGDAHAVHTLHGPDALVQSVAIRRLHLRLAQRRIHDTSGIRNSRGPRTEGARQPSSAAPRQRRRYHQPAKGTPPNPRLPRLHLWKVQTVSGRVYGASPTLRELDPPTQAPSQR